MSGPNPYQRSQRGESSNPLGIPPDGEAQSSSRYENLDYRTRVPTKATRRIRGEIACAECRRLKIRCDKNIPCSTCVKRGCSALCPNGTIPPGEGSRFVLAATDHLRQKLTRMEARMRSLEDALAIVNDATSDRPHPLLAIPFDDEEEEEPILKPVTEETSSENSALSDALGTILLDRQGSTRFFGPSGGSEGLLLKSGELQMASPLSATRPPLQELDPSYLPPEINNCYQSFPFTPQGIAAVPIQATIESFLPTVERAIALCETFLEHLSWMFSIVSRHQLVKELIPAIYKQIQVSYGPHDLALLLVVLGVGSLVDLNLPPYNLEAQHYYRLSRAAITLQPVLAEQSVVTIKVLHLMSIYNGMSGKESNLEQCYVLLDLAGQVALRTGFHIDPSMWGFDGREAYDRRVYFWNLIAGGLWQSLVTGRPPVLLTTFIDCRVPSAEDEGLFQQGEVPLGFGIWGFKASVECLVPLTKTMLSAKPPSYSTILELDRKIRTLVNPQSGSASSPDVDDRTAISMRVFVRSHYQELMLLFLHRAYFAQAMTENLGNPLSSPYSRSVFAAYSSACVVLDDTKAQYLKEPLLCGRVWMMWSFSFSAAVVVGTVAIRGLHLNFKPPPLQEFEEICKVFRSAAEINSRAAQAWPILQNMHQKALFARDMYCGEGKVVFPENSADDGLSLFGGKTRVINPDTLSISEPPSSHRGPEKSSLPQIPTVDSILTQPLHRSRTPPEPSYHSEQSGPSQVLPPLVLPRIPEVPRIPYSHLNPISIIPSQDIPQSLNVGNLPGDWDRLFSEIPQPGYQGIQPSAGPPHAGDEATTLNDRWSSFLQNYRVEGPASYQGKQQSHR